MQMYNFYTLFCRSCFVHEKYILNSYFWIYFEAKFVDNTAFNYFFTTLASMYK